MNANDLKATDLIGKTIVVGDNIATITIKSADGDTLHGEFQREGNAPMAMPIKLDNLKSMIDKKAWSFAKESTSEESGAEDVADAESSTSSEEAKEADPVAAEDDPVMKQWRKAKAEHQDAVIIFRNGEVYVVISDDATKVSEVTGLKIARHDDVSICVFPADSLSNMMPKIVGAGLRVAICDLAQDEQQPKAKAKPRVQPRTAPKEKEEVASDVSDEPAEPETSEPSEPAAEQPTQSKPKPRFSEVTVEAEKCSARIIENGKSIIVAGDTARIEAVLLTLWGRKRPYTHKGQTYSGIVLSAKHKATVREIIKLAYAS